MIVNFKVDGKLIWHVLCEVLHAPDADNCLLLISCFDVGGGDIHFKTGEAILRNRNKQIVGIGKIIIDFTSWMHEWNCWAGREQILHQPRNCHGISGTRDMDICQWAHWRS